LCVRHVRTFETHGRVSRRYVESGTAFWMHLEANGGHCVQKASGKIAAAASPSRAGIGCGWVTGVGRWRLIASAPTRC